MLFSVNVRHRYQLFYIVSPRCMEDAHISTIESSVANFHPSFVYTQLHIRYDASSSAPSLHTTRIEHAEANDIPEALPRQTIYDYHLTQTVSNLQNIG